MIYVDTSVVLAALLAENRCPAAEFWQLPLATSVLTRYETVNRMHARRKAEAIGAAMTLLLGMRLIALMPATLERALEPYPVNVGTLDGLHLASMDYLRREGLTVELASYDRRLCEAARAMGFAVLPV